MNQGRTYKSFIDLTDKALLFFTLNFDMLNWHHSIKRSDSIMRKTWILMVLSILTIGVLVACGDNNNNDDNADNNNQENNYEENSNDENGNQDNADNNNNNEGNDNENNAGDNGDNAEANGDLGFEEDMPEADLEGIPDIVAEINGEEITKDDFESIYEQQFQQQAMQAQMSGQSMDDIDQNDLKEQIAEAMVNQELLTQEANEKFSEVTDEDIDETINDLVEQNGMESKDDLLEAFEEQGIDEEELMSEVETQVKIDKLIADITKDIEITEDETKEAYETIKSQQEQADSEEEFPEFEDIKPDLEEQLKEQKSSEETESFVEKLREDAEVTINL